MELFSSRMLQALEFAAIAHKEQARRGGSHAPYVSHCAAVGLILSRAGFSEDVVIAGVLHDVIEDTPYGADDIIAQFGEHVVSIVKDVSEDKGLPFEQRKANYIEHLFQASTEAKAVSSADLLANLTSMLLTQEQGGDPWAIFSAGKEFTFDYYHRRIAALEAGFEHEIVQAVKLALQKIK